MKRKIICCTAFTTFSIIMYFWWIGSASLFSQGLALSLLALGRLCGLLAVYSILWQFLLAGRASLLEKEFGLDVLSRLHQRNGKIAITFILLHPILIILSYSMIGKISLLTQIAQFITGYEDVLNAIIAVVLFCIIVGTSMYIARRRMRYETWYYIHIFTYVATLLAFGHQLKLGHDFLGSSFFRLYWLVLYGLVFGLLIFFRFFKPLWNYSRHQFYVKQVIHETKSTVSFLISGKDLKNFHVKGGQFMIFRFLSKGLWHEAHPFSLSRLNDGKTIRFTAKKAGDFTLKIPHVVPGTKLVIDGPYGVFTTARAKSKKILFLAGGVGITPIRSLIQEMGPLGFEMILIYQNKTSDDIVFKKELEELSKKYKLKIIHLLTEAVTKNKRGGITEHRIVEFAPDFAKRDIYFCGSPEFLHITMHQLKALKVKKRRMHYEQFAFHFSNK